MTTTGGALETTGRSASASTTDGTSQPTAGCAFEATKGSASSDSATSDGGGDASSGPSASTTDEPSSDPPGGLETSMFPPSSDGGGDASNKLSTSSAALPSSCRALCLRWQVKEGKLPKGSYRKFSNLHVLGPHRAQNTFELACQLSGEL